MAPKPSREPRLDPIRDLTFEEQIAMRESYIDRLRDAMIDMLNSRTELSELREKLAACRDPFAKLNIQDRIDQLSDSAVFILTTTESERKEAEEGIE